MQNSSYFIEIQKLPQELEPGIRQVADEYQINLGKKNGAGEICFSPDRALSEKGGLKVCAADKIIVSYGRKIDAFRALGCLLGRSNEVPLKSGFVEYPRFDMVGAMLESSRNGVMTVDNVKAFLRRCALMGINVLMLYTEDTYEVPGQPFWGYLRGRYTQNELRELDSYACNLGIEMFPCLQTLAHLKQVLQWQESYKDVTDTEHILLVGEEKTYQLLEQIISAATTPFRSNRIHIGMDEAHGLGTGEYKKRHGERSPFDIMNEHLTQVCNICNRLGLKPMMWSDMYFRMGSETDAYYDLHTKIPEEVINGIPEGLELVYWDYYHPDYDFYVKFIDLHRRLGKELIVASGAWNWNRFWSALPLAYSTIEPCLRACKDKNINQVFITTWGDDGMENDIYSTLPALQFFAELSYADSVDEELLKADFRGACRADMDTYNLAGKLDSLPYLENSQHNTNNASKWLLWDDPFIGLCEPLQENQSFREHYADLAEDLERAIGKDAASKRLSFPAQIAKVLAIKCDCRKNLVSAYRDNDKKKIADLLEREVKPLLEEVKKLWQIHRDMWLATYKPFGLEVIEIRYGGLRARLESLITRLEQYLKDDINSIPEFETELLKFKKGSVDKSYHIDSYQRIATPSAIF
ncbi:MAG: beta-N-acetylhexosaminidase [Nitrospirae bacterium]|nr:beta-N-acetylhexosaminidase [Nitrospirota bacterium]